MLTSNSTIIGTATITCEVTSGGVITAAVKKMITTMTFLPFFIHSALTMPRAVRAQETTGSSKTTAKMIKMDSRNDT